MNEKPKKIIRIIIGIPFFASILIFFITGADWAKSMFFVMLAILCLYNLILNRPKINKD